MLVKKIEFRKPLNAAASKHTKLYNNDYFKINQEIIDKDLNYYYLWDNLEVQTEILDSEGVQGLSGRYITPNIYINNNLFTRKDYYSSKIFVVNEDGTKPGSDYKIELTSDNLCFYLDNTNVTNNIYRKAVIPSDLFIDLNKEYILAFRLDYFKWVNPNNIPINMSAIQSFKLSVDFNNIDGSSSSYALNIDSMHKCYYLKFIHTKPFNEMIIRIVLILKPGQTWIAPHNYIRFRKFSIAEFSDKTVEQEENNIYLDYLNFHINPRIVPESDLNFSNTFIEWPPLGEQRTVHCNLSDSKLYFTINSILRNERDTYDINYYTEGDVEKVKIMSWNTEAEYGVITELITLQNYWNFKANSIKYKVYYELYKSNGENEIPVTDINSEPCVILGNSVNYEISPIEPFKENIYLINSKEDLIELKLVIAQDPDNPIVPNGFKIRNIRIAYVIGEYIGRDVIGFDNEEMLLPISKTYDIRELPGNNPIHKIDINNAIFEFLEPQNLDIIELSICNKAGFYHFSSKASKIIHHNLDILIHTNNDKIINIGELKNLKLTYDSNDKEKLTLCVSNLDENIVSFPFNTKYIKISLPEDKPLFTPLDSNGEALMNTLIEQNKFDYKYLPLFKLDFFNNTEKHIYSIDETNLNIIFNNEESILISDNIDLISHDYRNPIKTLKEPKGIKIYNKDNTNKALNIICSFNEIKTIDKIDLICYDSFNLPIFNNEEYNDGEGPLPPLEKPIVLFNFKISYSKDGKNWYKLYNNFEEDLSKCVFLFGGDDRSQHT